MLGVWRRCLVASACRPGTDSMWHVAGTACGGPHALGSRREQWWCCRLKVLSPIVDRVAWSREAGLLVDETACLRRRPH